jgi:hypothetical protein
MSVNFDQVWIGLVDVGPLPGNSELGSARGALVKTVALAKSAEDFRGLVEAECADCGYFVKSFSEVEQFRELIARHPIAKKLRVLADQARRSKQVRFGTFHTYEDDEALN